MLLAQDGSCHVFVAARSMTGLLCSTTLAFHTRRTHFVGEELTGAPLVAAGNLPESHWTPVQLPDLIRCPVRPYSTVSVIRNVGSRAAAGAEGHPTRSPDRGTLAQPLTRFRIGTTDSNRVLHERRLPALHAKLAVSGGLWRERSPSSLFGLTEPSVQLRRGDPQESLWTLSEAT